MSGEYELVTLRNGERAVRNLRHGEVMHPSIGPWAEANRLYVEQLRLRERLARGRVRVYDVGLGAAANACAALNCAAALNSATALNSTTAIAEASPLPSGEGQGEGCSDQRSNPAPRTQTMVQAHDANFPHPNPLPKGEGAGCLELISFEHDLEPLKLALSDPQGFPFVAKFRDACEAILRDGRWQSWTLLLGDFLDQLPRAAAPADLIFFDPFSPDTNPGLWTRDVFSKLRARCSDDAALATYSASTGVRADLLAAGFYVGAGVSVGTKQETTIASTRLETLENPLGARWLQRFRRSPAFTAERDFALSRHPQFAAARSDPPPTR